MTKNKPIQIGGLEYSKKEWNEMDERYKERLKKKAGSMGIDVFSMPATIQIDTSEGEK